VIYGSIVEIIVIVVVALLMGMRHDKRAVTEVRRDEVRAIAAIGGLKSNPKRRVFALLPIFYF
jgi:hypothetical protein